MKLHSYLFTTLTLSTIFCLSLHADNTQATATKSGYFDVIEDVNPYDQEFARQEQERQKVVFGAFSGIVQNLFCIVQDPKNPTNIANNVAAMVASIISTGMTVTRGMPSQSAIEERQQLISEIMVAIERELALLATRC